MTRRRRDGDSSRDAILDAATKLLAGRGYVGMSVAALSQAAGVSSSSIYWHFGSKDGVLAAVVERRILQFFARHPDSRLTPGNPQQRLQNMMNGSADAFESEPDPLRLLLLLILEARDGQAGQPDAVSRMRERAAERWSDAISDTVPGRGQLHGIDIAELAVFCRAVADGALIAGLADDDVRTRDVYATLGKVLFALMAADSSAGESR